MRPVENGTQYDTVVSDCFVTIIPRKGSGGSLFFIIKVHAGALTRYFGIRFVKSISTATETNNYLVFFDMRKHPTP